MYIIYTTLIYIGTFGMQVESLRGDIRGTFLRPFSLLGASRPASVSLLSLLGIPALAQLSGAMCNDRPVNGESSKQACCKCGGGKKCLGT